jgi:hypothetical protein
MLHGVKRYFEKLREQNKSDEKLYFGSIHCYKRNLNYLYNHVKSKKYQQSSGLIGPNLGTWMFMHEDFKMTRKYSLR